jgi:diadenosine tetraphosphatase ApaH/serine/threonine PP2A family protein phosphatase
MTILDISPKLAHAIEVEAQDHGLSVEEFLRRTLQRERTLTARRKIEQEQAWWFSLPLSQRAAYEGQYVAVHNQRLIDHDYDLDRLHQRVRAQYGALPILVIPAEGPPEIHIFSPRVQP